MIPKPFAFVLMPFGNEFRDTYLLGIKPACEEAGYYCERLDEQIFQETMLDRIYNQIAKADLIVADMTDRNPNVFYETGYAHALGKQVILLTRNSEDIPFDLKHYSHIIYSNGITELKQELYKRAAYYAANPGTPSRDPFSQFMLLLNGVTIEASDSTVDIESNLTFREENNSYRHYLPLEAAFHLSEDALDTEINVDVRLITDATLSSSGRSFSENTSEIYTTIPMPDGQLMHKPNNPVRISLGDPDKAVFDLYPQGIKSEQVYLMTLRLLSSGLQRDISVQVSLKD